MRENSAPTWGEESLKIELPPTAGCGSKIPPHILKKCLSEITNFKDPRVIIDGECGDDAGIILLSNHQATVLTVDIFTPITDHPYDFGQIAAANALSDVYAMRASPQSALSFIGFPLQKYPEKVLTEILRGGAEKFAEAGIQIIGGHSLQDGQLKCGYAVLGEIAPEDVIRNSNAKNRDVIVLTKPLGTGILAYAYQHQLIPQKDFSPAVESMKKLNKNASECLMGLQAHAITDITGFGFIYHLFNILKESRCSAEIFFDKIPFFDAVKPCACQRIFPKATTSNRNATSMENFDFSTLSLAQMNTLFSPETSGGLLVFLPDEEAQKYLECLEKKGEKGVIIGRIDKDATAPRIEVKSIRADEWEEHDIVHFTSSAPTPNSETTCAFTYPDTHQPVHFIESHWGESPIHFFKNRPHFLGGHGGKIFAGFFLAFLFVGLSLFGNPADMGICTACFIRDTAGAFGLHSFWKGCFIRPELLGILLGACLGAMLSGEFKARGSNNALTSFLLGGIGISASLIFLGCPWRAFGRLFSGDLTALSGVIGLIIGIWVGCLFLKKGYTLGNKATQSPLLKWVTPYVALAILGIAFLPNTSVPTSQPLNIPLISSAGPGSMAASGFITFPATLVLGLILQRSRFCTIGGFRDSFLHRNFTALLGVGAFFAGILIFAFGSGQFSLGFEGHFATHSYHTLSFVALFIAGISFTLAGGCPGRQLTMAASGDGDAVFFVCGMILFIPLLNALGLLQITAESCASAWGCLGVMGVAIFIIGVGMRTRH